MVIHICVIDYSLKVQFKFFNAGQSAGIEKFFNRTADGEWLGTAALGMSVIF